MGLEKWLNDHTAEIYPECPNSVVFNDYYWSRGNLYISFSVFCGAGSYDDSRKVELEDVLKYIE